MGRQSNWLPQEDEILLKILQEEKSKKWKKVSLKLKEEKFYRTPSQCRERFINYLMKDIDKSQIRDDELEILYQKYDQVGPKWSYIQSFLTSRTQCKLKNIFYGNIINVLKTSYKYFTQKTAFFINSLSTDQLIYIYDATNIFQGMSQIKNGIKYMKYRNNKALIYSTIIANQDAYLKLLNTILVQIYKQKPLQKTITAEKTNRLIEKYRLSSSKSEEQEQQLLQFCKSQYNVDNVKIQPSQFHIQQHFRYEQFKEQKKPQEKISVKQEELAFIKQQEDKDFRQEIKEDNVDKSYRAEDQEMMEYYRQANYRPFIDPLIPPYHYPFLPFYNYPPFKK